MKQRMIRLMAVLSLVAVLCASLASCGVSDPFDVYWQYLEESEDVQLSCNPEPSANVTVRAVTDKTQGEQIQWQVLTSQAHTDGTTYEYELTLVMNGVQKEYDYDYCVRAYLANGNKILTSKASGCVAPAAFDGEQLLEFSQYEYRMINERADREHATSLMKMLVMGMEMLTKDSQLAAADFGFSASWAVTTPDAEVPADDTENLGGAFSVARWVYAGKMTLLGMGMVFLVLTILWAVLKIFEKCLYHPKKEAAPVKEESAPTPAPAVSTPEPALAQQPAPVAATDDGVLLAVITAAVAAAMEEEGIASGGFRVVSFKKTTQRGGPWNG